MSWIDGLRHRIRVLLRPDAYADEVQEEFEFHQQLAVMNGIKYDGKIAPIRD